MADRLPGLRIAFLQPASVHPTPFPPLSASTLVQLKQLFDKRQYQAIIELAHQEAITPAGDPLQGQAVAGALFHIGRYGDCLQWCEGLAPALSGQAGFASLHGAVLRRLGRLEQAEQVFRAALANHPEEQQLRNNFANLLIDRGQLEEAETLLKQLLAENPAYEDAKANLNRLGFQRSMAPKPPVSAAVPLPRNAAGLVDPLLAAFSDEEVKLAGGSPPVSTDPTQALVAGLPPRSLPAEQEELLSFARAQIATAPDQAIADCGNLQRTLGVRPELYAIAGEAYIRLQLFADAEVCLLSALALGSVDGAVWLNLANLASMRGDHALALAWLEQLASQQPDHPQLAQVRDALFPPGQPRPQGAPFQIVLEQCAPGQFLPRASAAAVPMA